MGRMSAPATSMESAIRDALATVEDPEIHRPITDQDKRVQSPYNTYLHQGVPPGPIASPGLASLVGALNPANVAYLYYVSDSSGHNHYATTYQEFLRLKAKYIG